MNEAIRNAALFLWAFCAVNSEAYAAEPSTIIYGASETAPGVHDSAVVRFRDDEGNIMGQPIDVGGFESAADNGQPPAVSPVEAVSASEKRPAVISETLPQNPSISSDETPQKVNRQIQNTLYGSGGRIYDVQSYPAEDIDKIEEPNIQPTVTTYPSY